MQCRNFSLHSGCKQVQAHRSRPAAWRKIISERGALSVLCSMPQRHKTTQRGHQRSASSLRYAHSLPPARARLTRPHGRPDWPRPPGARPGPRPPRRGPQRRRAPPPTARRPAGPPCSAPRRPRRCWPPAGRAARAQQPLSAPPQTTASFPGRHGVRDASRVRPLWTLPPRPMRMTRPLRAPRLPADTALCRPRHCWPPGARAPAHNAARDCCLSALLQALVARARAGRPVRAGSPLSMRRTQGPPGSAPGPAAHPLIAPRPAHARHRRASP